MAQWEDDFTDLTRLQGAMKLLPERPRRVLEMSYLKALPQDAIATHFKISPMHVSSLHPRALLDLRARMDTKVEG